MACKSCKCKPAKLSPLPSNTVGAHVRKKKKEDIIQKALRRLRKAAQEAGVRK